MKKFLKKLLLFIPFAGLFYAMMLLICGTNKIPSDYRPNLIYKIVSIGHMFTRMKEVEQFSNVDILFLGSSHAYRGFDTRIFKKHGLNVFNLGSSSQSPIQSYFLLKQYVKQLNPKLIIFEVYPLTFNNDGVEPSLDIIANSKNSIYNFKMAWNINHIYTWNALIYGFLRNALNMNADIIEPQRKGTDTYITGGYVERDLKFAKYKQQKMKTWTLNEKQFSFLNKIIHTANKHGIKTILVYAPISGSLYNSYDNNDEFNDRISEYSTYYNFNNLLQMSDSLYFFNPDHLNQLGVELFNEKLIELIRKSFSKSVCFHTEICVQKDTLVTSK